MPRVRLPLFDGRVPGWLLPAAWILFACYGLGVVASGWFFDRSSERMVREEIDARLRVAVHLATAAFPADLRSRAAVGPPLSAEEDEAFEQRADALCRESGIAFLYALYMDSDGTVRHLWTNDEDDEPHAWFTYPYEDCSESAKVAIRTGAGLHYDTYTDQWGDFRGAYLGLTDPAGHTYAIGADLFLSEVETALAKNRRQVIIAAGIAALAGLLLALGLHRLIRRLQQAQRDLGLLAEVAHATGHAVILADADATVRWANAACAHHLGVDSASVLGRPLAELLDPSAMQEVAASVAQACSGVGVSRELPGPGAPGASWLLADLRPVAHPPGKPWVVCLLRDLSARRATEDGLRRASEEAARIAAAKSAFLANMSHEIRTPLNGMLGMTGLLLDRPLDPSSRELVELAHRSGEVLLKLLSDILDLTKIEAGAMRLDVQPCDLAAVVHEVGGLFRVNAQAKGLELRVSGSPTWVRCDALRLRQALSNLVSNAIKFTESGHVAIALESFDDGPRRMVHLVVSDTGIGIPSERQGELFRPFSQVDDSMTRRSGGTGLGLAISRRLIGLMGGALTLHSAPGEGSAFSIDLALPPAQAPDGRSAARALVVDGNRGSRTVAMMQLRSLGIAEVEQAADAASAFEAWSGGPWHLVLLDAQLPGGTDELLAAMRAARPPPTLIIIGAGEGLAADAVLARPLAAEALRAAVERHRIR